MKITKTTCPVLLLNSLCPPPPQEGQREQRRVRGEQPGGAGHPTLHPSLAHL
jgi:hypothetical protein